MSSLFSARGWWNVNGSTQDAFDRGGLCTTTGSGENAVIVMGGFSGKLRLYNPKAGGFDPSHLALEVQLDQAIIQLASGCFTENGPRDQIAVLHPRKFVVYTVEANADGSGDQGEETKLTKLYEHLLPRTSANFTHGPFGGRGADNSRWDSVCIQSMDGTLTFVNQDQAGFECFIPGFLIPGPLCYMSV
jgi:Bardet-Biedl syndrome 9 protein